MNMHDVLQAQSAAIPHFFKDANVPACRHCHAPMSLKMVDLGSSPPSNAFNDRPEVLEKNYPLRVMVCEECWLAQTDIGLFKLDHDELFTDEYPYFSSTSASWVQHARDFIERITKQLELGPDSLVVEVGCNDGYLLQWVKTPCYGVEPTNTRSKATERGIEVFPQFFGQKWAENAALLRGKADLMIANNVLAHVPDINDFVAGFRALLKPDGMAVFEFPHLLSLVRNGQFDTIYHEHYSYLSLTSALAIFADAELEVFGVEKLETHGGSLRLYVGHRGHHHVSDRVGAVLREELAAGVNTAGFYNGFQEGADRVKDALLRFLLDAKDQGAKVAGFGAAAKGNTLLNYAGVRADLLPYVVDDTPAKQGKFLPGSGIPVRADFDGVPDYIFVLPWNFREEIRGRLASLCARGSRLVFAIPRLEVV